MSEPFYIYVDWTTEEAPRPYYVGYGNKVRIRKGVVAFFAL